MPPQVMPIWHRSWLHPLCRLPRKVDASRKQAKSRHHWQRSPTRSATREFQQAALLTVRDASCARCASKTMLMNWVDVEKRFEHTVAAVEPHGSRSMTSGGGSSPAGAESASGVG